MIRRAASGLESRWAQILIVALVCWWAFAFRFAKPDFTNDDFQHLSEARQVLSGELPERDFYDDGRPLTIYASALVQYLSPTLFSELIFRAGAIAAGVGFVYVLARALSQSTVLGLLAAMLTMAIQPRLYNYAKVLLFPMGLWLLWRYVDRPSRGRVISLAVMTVMAFLFRYDYGVYLAFVYAATFLMIHRARALLPVALYVGVGLACCAPYLVWLAREGQLVSTGSGGATSMLANMSGLTRAPLHLDLSRGLIHFGPPDAIVSVRWSETTDGTTEAELEHRYGLRPIGSRPDGRTVRYAMEDPSHDLLRMMIEDRHIDDTSGIDRGNASLIDSPPREWWRSLVPQMRSTVFPTSQDAQAWIYYVFVLSVPVVLLVLWYDVNRGDSHDALKVTSAALLCVLLHQFMILGAFEARLPDVAGPSAVLLAWLGSRAVVAWRRSIGIWAAVRQTVILMLVAILFAMTGLGVGLCADTSLGAVLTAGMARPAKLADVSRRLNRRPLDVWTAEQSTGAAGLSQYIAACLAPADRLLLVSFEPEVFYLSERLFAGGVNHFQANGFNSTSAEILSRLRGQSVPLVVVDEKYRESFDQNWTELSRYVRTRYREAATLGFGDDNRSFHILVDVQRLPAGTDARWGLPCFAAP